MAFAGHPAAHHAEDRPQPHLEHLHEAGGGGRAQAIVKAREAGMG
jgi:hypothetical protein